MDVNNSFPKHSKLHLSLSKECLSNAQSAMGMGNWAHLWQLVHEGDLDLNSKCNPMQKKSVHVVVYNVLCSERHLELV